jgi:hypothetical protein
MKKLKLIWDFYGDDAVPIAEHHQIHLNEFVEREKLPLKITGTHTFSPQHAVAYIVVYESEMIRVRDLLRPHRGEWYVED